LWWHKVDPRTGSVAFYEDLVGYAAHVRFADGIDLVELAK
jgi:hypothetical protein